MRLRGIAVPLGCSLRCAKCKWLWRMGWTLVRLCVWKILLSGGALVSNLALASGPSVKLGLSNPAVKAGGRSGPY